MKKTILLCTLVAAGICALPVFSYAALLTQASFTTLSGAGQDPAAAASTAMIMSDGSSWAGGAAGVQGPAGTRVGGGSALAANVAFKYNIGSVVDSLNATYGAGAWTIENPNLSFQYTLYANNTRFNGGAGTFDIMWVGNDSWVQGSNNPIFATSATALSGWSGNQALLASEYYDWSTPTYQGTTADLSTGAWVTDKTGNRQSVMNYSLGTDSLFLDDILSASAGGNSAVSLYLMATSDTLGLCIFTGGASMLPTLSFDVVDAAPVPIPAAAWLLGSGIVGLVGVRRRKAAC
jgi:hypothetical protein